jgi:hypothetical protein
MEPTRGLPRHDDMTRPGFLIVVPCLSSTVGPGVDRSPTDRGGAVPLSEHEQRLLEQMERALYAEDPKFVSSLRSTGPRPGSRRRAAVGVLTALVGFGLLVTGAATSLVVVGVVGFLAMLLGTFLVVTTMRPQPETSATAPAGPQTKPGKKAQKAGFMDRVEERFRKRREGDDT